MPHVLYIVSRGCTPSWGWIPADGHGVLIVQICMLPLSGAAGRPWNPVPKVCLHRSLSRADEPNEDSALNAPKQ